ncbi:MAG TPA: hypothetical protein VEA63_06000, partial [Opitutus sp.]|nr:hypothetical protein [Opitutus sp.]
MHRLTLRLFLLFLSPLLAAASDASPFSVHLAWRDGAPRGQVEVTPGRLDRIDILDTNGSVA